MSEVTNDRVFGHRNGYVKTEAYGIPPHCHPLSAIFENGFCLQWGSRLISKIKRGFTIWASVKNVHRDIGGVPR